VQRQRAGVLDAAARRRGGRSAVQDEDAVHHQGARGGDLGDADGGRGHVAPDRGGRTADEAYVPRDDRQGVGGRRGGGDVVGAVRGEVQSGRRRVGGGD